MDKRRSAECHRVLAAIGCIPSDRIGKAASDIYRTGFHESDLGLRIRLLAIGRERRRRTSCELSQRDPGIARLGIVGDDVAARALEAGLGRQPERSDRPRP